MRYCKISKEISSLFFGLDVFCQFEGRSQNLTQFSVYSVHNIKGGRGSMSNSGTVASNRQNTASTKYNYDLSLLISPYLISGREDFQSLSGVQTVLLLLCEENQILPVLSLNF
jgi:hypothetical protein